MHKIKQLFSALLNQSSEAHCAQPPDLHDTTSHAVSEIKQTDPFHLGLKDIGLNGWFNQATGELAPGYQINEDDIILDAGCGAGGQALFAAKTGAHVVLLDIDADKVAESAKRLSSTKARKIDTLISDANPIPLPDESLTKIMSSEVIEHVDDPKAFIEELVRVGKPGARYLLTCPDETSERVLEGIAADFYFKKPHHIRVLSRTEFRKLAENAGLIIEDHIFYGSFWTIWWMLYWTYEKDLSAPWHPVTDQWSSLWKQLINTDEGLKIKLALDKAIPKSQVLIARKP